MWYNNCIKTIKDYNSQKNMSINNITLGININSGIGCGNKATGNKAEADISGNEINKKEIYTRASDKDLMLMKLKDQLSSGKYQINFDNLANKIIETGDMV